MGVILLHVCNCTCKRADEPALSYLGIETAEKMVVWLETKYLSKCFALATSWVNLHVCKCVPFSNPENGWTHCAEIDKFRVVKLKVQLL